MLQISCLKRQIWHPKTQKASPTASRAWLNQRVTLPRRPSSLTLTSKTIRIASTSPPTCSQILRRLQPSLSRSPPPTRENQFVLATFYAHLSPRTSDWTLKQLDSHSCCPSLAKNPPNWQNKRHLRHLKRLRWPTRGSKDRAKWPCQSKFLASPPLNSDSQMRQMSVLPTKRWPFHRFQRRCSESQRL